MRLRDSFWALLGRNTEVVPAKVLESVRLSMLMAIDEHCQSAEHHLDDRISFSKDLGSLWYLRADLSDAIANCKGEAVAREALANITKLFKGFEPSPNRGVSHRTLGDENSKSRETSDLGSTQWNEAYKIGNPSIDDQHEAWFKRVNHFLGASDKRSLMLCELEMLQYTRTHFESEEALMFAVDYPAYAQHVEQHRMMLELLKRISDQIAGDSLDLSAWKSFLTEWLLDHIRDHDTKLADYLRCDSPKEMPRHRDEILCG